MIRIARLSVRLGRHVTLADVSLRVAQGELVLLTGPSGCGKTTLARCLNGLIPHSVPAEMSGRVIVDGKDTSSHTVAELSASAGLVFQNPAHQLFHLNVDEEIAFGPRNLGMNEIEVTRRVEWALEAVGIPHLRGRDIQSLSGGEKQRVAIAVVLAMGARVLILDEPTSSLDVAGTRQVVRTLSRLNREHGVTILAIEHRLGELARCAGRTIVMAEGRIAADGRTRDIFRQRDLLDQYGLRRPAEEAQEEWTALLEPIAEPVGPPIVELRNVEAGYGRTKVLHDLDLTLHAGELTALVGDNGAGKTTLTRLLTGFIKPLSGSVRIANACRSRRNGRVGLLFQDPLHQLFCETVDEEVAFGPRNFDGFDPQRLIPILEATQLLPYRRRRVHRLSSGQQQRTALAAVLSLEPSLVILDEPTMGQDWGHLSRFMDFLLELNRSGTTILLITHDYKLVHRYARRILLLRDGRIVADGAPAGVEPETRGDSKYDSQFVTW